MSVVQEYNNNATHCPPFLPAICKLRSEEPFLLVRVCVSREPASEIPRCAAPHFGLIDRTKAATREQETRTEYVICGTIIFSVNQLEGSGLTGGTQRQ